MEHERDFFLRGNPHLYDIVVPRFIIRWIEPIQHDVLQDSINAVIRKSPWVCYTLLNRDSAPELAVAKGLCRVHDRYQKRRIPEEPGGFLFSVSCEKNTIYFDYDHFLTDGHGIAWLILEMLCEYYNRVYGMQVPYTPLESKELPSFDELIHCFEPVPFTGSASPLRDFNKNKQHLLLRLEKKDVTDRALELNRKPFVFLASLLCLSAMRAKEESKISFFFTVDARKRFNCQDVFYNFSEYIKGVVALTDGVEEIRNSISQLVEKSSMPGASEANMIGYLQALDALARMKTTQAVKRNVYKKMAASARADVGISYMGSVLTGKYDVLRPFVSDFQIWMDAGQSELLFVETTVENTLILAITHCLPNRKVAESLRTVMKENKVRIKELSEVNGDKHLPIHEHGEGVSYA